VVTNDPDSKKIILNVAAGIKEGLSVMPGYVNFEKVNSGSSYSREIVLTNNGKDTATISKITVSSPEQISLNAKPPLSIDPGQARRLTLTFKPGKNKESFTGTISLETEQSKQTSRKSIHIRAEISEN